MATKAKKRYEKDVVEVILTGLRSAVKKGFGVKMLKTHGNSFSVIGTPDLMGTVNGRHVVIEVKLSPNKPTPAQHNQLDEWAAAGSIALWVDDTVGVATLTAFVVAAAYEKWYFNTLNDWMEAFIEYGKAFDEYRNTVMELSATGGSVITH